MNRPFGPDDPDDVLSLPRWLAHVPHAAAPAGTQPPLRRTLVSLLAAVAVGVVIGAALMVLLMPASGARSARMAVSMATAPAAPGMQDASTTSQLSSEIDEFDAQKKAAAVTELPPQF